MIRYQIADGSRPLRGDVDIIQIRAPRLSVRELAALVRLAMTAGPRILVNDRLDVALACGAAGVHLRSDFIAPRVARRIAPAGFTITVACHDEEDIGRSEGADYAILAPVFRPLSKVDSRPTLGLRELRRLCRLSPVPVIALGGITESNAASCMEAGACGVAGISLFG